jgi:hypothetical protein
MDKKSNIRKKKDIHLVIPHKLWENIKKDSTIHQISVTYKIREIIEIYYHNKGVYND